MAKKEQMVKKAVEYMRILGISDDLIEKFQRGEDVIYMGGAHPLDLMYEKKEEILKKIDEIEARHECLVYALGLTDSPYGQLVNFLVVSGYPEDWEMSAPQAIGKAGKIFRSYAYVWNRTHEDYSEFGTIMLEWISGKLVRVDI